MFLEILNSLRVPRIGRGTQRTTPNSALSDQCSSSKTNRLMLRDHGIEAAIPERSGQIANGKRLVRAGSRLPGLDKKAENAATPSTMSCRLHAAAR